MIIMPHCFDLIGTRWFFISKGHDDDDDDDDDDDGKTLHILVVHMIESVLTNTCHCYGSSYSQVTRQKKEREYQKNICRELNHTPAKTCSSVLELFSIF